MPNHFLDRNSQQWVIIPGSNYLDGTSGQRILDIVTAALEMGLTYFAIDLSTTRVVNSVGISRLIQLIETLETQNGRVTFCAPNNVVAKTFRIMGLLQKTTIFNSIHEAAQTLP